MKNKIALKFTLILTLIHGSIAHAQVTFQQTYGGSLGDYGRCVQQTNDGGYIIAGETNSFGSSNYDVYLIKTSSTGTSQWTKTFGGSGAASDLGKSVMQTIDGGYIIGGNTTGFGAGLEDIYLVKAASDGSLEWTKTFGGTMRDYGYSIQQTIDGGYIIGGYTQSF